MAGSENDNEPYYDEDEGDRGERGPEGLSEPEPDEFVIAHPALTSSDPHRTLSFDPHRIGERANELMRPPPGSRSMAERVREFRSRCAKPAGGLKSAPQQALRADLGPCLYFGPAGQRCERRATAGGFCSRHQPKDASALGETRSISFPQISKRALGAAGIIAVLWPLLFDLIREILRFLR